MTHSFSNFYDDHVCVDDKPVWDDSAGVMMMVWMIPYTPPPNTETSLGHRERSTCEARASRMRPREPPRLRTISTKTVTPSKELSFRSRARAFLLTSLATVTLLTFSANHSHAFSFAQCRLHFAACPRIPSLAICLSDFSIEARTGVCLLFYHFFPLATSSRLLLHHLRALYVRV